MSGPIRVLVVEPDPVTARLLALLIGAAPDMEALSARDGETGLALAQESAPDVVLLDLVLPGISGLELIRRYRSGGGKAGVLVLTGAVSGRAADMAMAGGADLLLSKPFQWEELAWTIRFLAGGLARCCQELLVEMGASPHGLGTRQAALCAGLLGERKDSQLKEAYVDAAARENCTVASIEKNVRVLIRRLHEAGSPAYYRMMGAEAPFQRPTNKDFLRRLARRAAEVEGAPRG